MELLDSRSAAEFLGIQPETLYAYVSRGVLESVRDPDDARRRCYRKADLERLKRRSEATSGHGAAAAGALDWGAPVLETAISRITPIGPSYRGERLRTLIEQEWSYEEVAEMLWSSERRVDPGAWAEARTDAAASLAGIDRAEDSPAIDRFRHGLSAVALDDDRRFVDTAPARRQVARRIVWTLAGLLIDVPDNPPASVAEFVAADLLESPTDAECRAVETALVAAAEHELNASAFAARVTASTGADLYACVTAALSGMAGPRHGRASQRAANLLSNVLDGEDPGAELAERLRGGETFPGFGHPLYPGGDPRFDHILAAIREATTSEIPERVDALVDAAEDLDLPPPNLDLGLAALTVLFDLSADTATGLFAVGRSAGWIAHSLEQADRNQLLRPRARYVE